ncbi:MAG: HAD hydrolase-like protein, partial [Lachnospiraceae bacterium]|nr:HAD hydrolase-like protein [Lachnospiraceae bacterium]
MGYRYLLFDLDGTLTDPKEGITKSFQYALESFGIHEPDTDKLTWIIGPPLMESLIKGYGFTEEQAKLGTEKYRERFHPIGWAENKVYHG